MNSLIKKEVTSAETSLLNFLKWILIAVVVGCTVGVAGGLFHHAIDWCTQLREAHGWILFFMPIAGLVIVGCYHLIGMANDQGTEFVILAAREGRLLRVRTAPLIVISTILTHLTGGSAGREGAALQLGGCLANAFTKPFRLNEQGKQMLTMCGMSAGFSALFGTPLASAVFAMEMESIGLMYYSALLPCVLSALVAEMVASALGVHPTAFALAKVPALSPVTLVQTMVLGVLFALLSMLFCTVMQQGSKLCKRIENPYLRIFLGGIAVVTLTLLVGSGDYNGAGMNVIASAIACKAVPLAFLLKMVFTSITLGSGFKGGEIVPSFFVGATFGCVAAPLVGMDAGFGAALGLIALFCGVTNAPVTSTLLGLELFGGQGLPLMALCLAVSYLLSGYSGLYHAQKIILSKTEPVLTETDNSEN